jgi:hypothetical protein
VVAGVFGEELGGELEADAAVGCWVLSCVEGERVRFWCGRRTAGDEDDGSCCGCHDCCEGLLRSGLLG